MIKIPCLKDGSEDLFLFNGRLGLTGNILKNHTYFLFDGFDRPQDLDMKTLMEQLDVQQMKGQLKRPLAFFRWGLARRHPIKTGDV